MSNLFDHTLVRAGIAGEEKEKHGKVIRLHKTDELGRKLTVHSFRHTYATLQAQAVACGTAEVPEETVRAVATPEPTDRSLTSNERPSWIN